MTKLADIAWAAGFLEGEGYFVFSETCPQIFASQKEREPLDKLERLFGGRIHYIKNGINKDGTQRMIYRWNHSRRETAGLLMTLYSFLSARRQATIKKMLEAWKARPTRGRYAREIVA